MKKKPGKPAKNKPRKQSTIAKELAAIPDAKSEPTPAQAAAPTPASRTEPKFRNRIKERRRVKACDLIPNPKNPRLHPQNQKDAMLGILNELGKVATLRAVETPNGLMLLDGHLRAELDAEEEWDVDILDLTPKEADYLLGTFDAVSAQAVHDPALLAALLAEIETEEAAVQAMLDAMAAAAPVPPAEGLTDPDEVPPVPVVPVTQPGDLWVMGEHKLLCGDSTDPGNVLLLMGEERAGLMAVDPPYGVAYANDDRPNPGVANDGLADEELQAFLEKAFSAAVKHALRPEAAWYLWHAHLTQGYFAAAAAAANVVLHRQIIWVKPVLLLGRGQYHWKHEPCFMGWVQGQQPPDYGLGNGERTQTTIWELGTVTQAERKELNHSTPKPVALFEIPIVKHLKTGEICFDGFAGSGPQLIAAQKTGRRFFGMEIEPRFVDTILQRFLAFTNIDPIRESDGAKFSALIEAR